MDFSSPLNEMVSNQLGVNNPQMANIWSQGMIDSAEVLGRNDHILQPFSTGIETQVLGEQIIQEPPFSIALAATQVNPATSCQNYNVVSAPCDDGGPGRPILDPQVYNNIMNPWMSGQELQCIDQNKYIGWVRSSLNNFIDSRKEENLESNNNILGAPSCWL